MALPGFDDTSLFENTQISPTVSAEAAPSFFEKYGVFYQANAEIGELATNLVTNKVSEKDISSFEPLLEKDARLYNILKPFIAQKPIFCFTLGSDAGNFYALTITEDTYPRAVVYMWQPKTQLEFSHGSHIGPAKGVASSNGLTHIPYSNLSKTRNLEDVSISFDEGGIMVVHPRLAISVNGGFAIAFGCQKPAS